MRREPLVGGCPLRAQINRILSPVYRTADFNYLLPDFKSDTLLTIVAGGEAKTPIADRALKILEEREAFLSGSSSEFILALTEELPSDRLTGVHDIKERHQDALRCYLQAAYDVDIATARAQALAYLVDLFNQHLADGEDPLALLYQHVDQDARDKGTPTRTALPDVSSVPFPLSGFLTLVHEAIPEGDANWELRRRILLMASVAGLDAEQITIALDDPSHWVYPRVLNQLVCDWARLWSRWLIATAESGEATESSAIEKQTDADFRVEVPHSENEQDHRD